MHSTKVATSQEHISQATKGPPRVMQWRPKSLVPPFQVDTQETISVIIHSIPYMPTVPQPEACEDESTNQGIATITTNEATQVEEPQEPSPLNPKIMLHT